MSVSMYLIAFRSTWCICAVLARLFVLSIRLGPFLFTSPLASTSFNLVISRRVNITCILRILWHPSQQVLHQNALPLMCFEVVILEDRPILRTTGFLPVLGLHQELRYQQWCQRREAGQAAFANHFQVLADSIIYLQIDVLQPPLRRIAV